VNNGNETEKVNGTKKGKKRKKRKKKIKKKKKKKGLVWFKKKLDKGKQVYASSLLSLALSAFSTFFFSSSSS